MTKEKRQMVGEEILAYNRAHEWTRRSITQSILELMLRSLVSPDPGEVAENDTAIADLQAKKALHDAKWLAFEANGESVTPPEPAQLEKLKGLLEEVERLTNEARIVTEVIRLTTASLSTFREIHADQA